MNSHKWKCFVHLWRPIAILNKFVFPFQVKKLVYVCERYIHVLNYEKYGNLFGRFKLLVLIVIKTTTKVQTQIKQFRCSCLSMF